MHKRGMLGKKAQIMVFVVIAIIIIAVFILLFLLRSRIAPEIPPTGIESPQVEPIRLFMEECISDASYAGLEHLGLYAGYNDFDSSGLKSIDLSGEKVVVVQKLNGKFVNRLPNQQQIESEFEKYMEQQGYDAVDECISDFESFRGQFNVRHDDAARRIFIDIRDDDVIVKTIWPVTVGRGQTASSVIPKDIRLLIPLGNILRVANEIINKEVSGVSFEGTEIDKYIKSLPSRLRNLKLEAQHYPTYEQNLFFLTTIPYRPGELEYKFYFAVDRE